MLVLSSDFFVMAHPVGASLVWLTACAKSNGPHWGKERVETTSLQTPWGSTHRELHTLHTITQTNLLAMGSVYLWKLSSQKLGFFLVSFGFIWGMMLLHFTIQQRATHESSAQLRMQILDLSKRYIKALAEENQSVMDGPYVGTMTAYGESLCLSFAFIVLFFPFLQVLIMLRVVGLWLY